MAALCAAASVAPGRIGAGSCPAIVATMIGVNHPVPHTIVSTAKAFTSPALDTAERFSRGGVAGIAVGVRLRSPGKRSCLMLGRSRGE